MLHKERRYIAISMLCLLVAYSILYLLSYETIAMLAQEDGIYETATAVWFLITAIIFFYLFFKDATGNQFFRLKLRKNIFFLLLGLLFVFGAGEEISWGQRLLDLQTPESFRKSNVQGELNIHNLSIFHGSNQLGEKKTGLARYLTSGRLFTLFWLFWCFMLPVFCKINSKFAKWLGNMNLPVVSISIGVLFLLNYLISKLIELTTSDNLNHYIVEIKEHNFGLLFFVVGLWFIANYRDKMTVRKTREALT